MENHCKVEKYPKVNEKFKVKTWVNKMEKIYAIRHYQIEDEKGNVILQSYTKWIMYSFERLRPIKILQEVDDMFEYTDKTTVKIDNINFDNVQVKESETKNSIVRYKDIDTNWHMNNVSYINAALETMGKEFLDSNEVVECKVEYRHQLLYNTAFSIEKNKINDLEYIYYIKKVQKEDEKLQKGNNANIYIKWRRKSEPYN